jgi:hypothetical protein
MALVRVHESVYLAGMTAPRRAIRKPEPRRGGSRPRHASGAAASRGVRLPPDTLQRTEAAATAAGLTWSTWVARALDDAAERAGVAGAPLSTFDDVLAYVIDHADAITDSVDGLLGSLVGDVAALRRAVVAAWADGRSAELISACRQHAAASQE